MNNIKIVAPNLDTRDRRTKYISSLKGKTIVKIRSKRIIEISRMQKKDIDANKKSKSYSI